MAGVGKVPISPRMVVVLTAPATVIPEPARTANPEADPTLRGKVVDAEAFWNRTTAAKVVARMVDKRVERISFVAWSRARFLMVGMPRVGGGGCSADRPQNAFRYID